MKDDPGFKKVCVTCGESVVATTADDLYKDYLAHRERCLERLAMDQGKLAKITEEAFIEAINHTRSHYPPTVFSPMLRTQDGISAHMARKTCDNILNEARRRFEEKYDALREEREG